VIVSLRLVVKMIDCEVTFASFFTILGGGVEICDRGATLYSIFHIFFHFSQLTINLELFRTRGIRLFGRWPWKSEPAKESCNNSPA